MNPFPARKELGNYSAYRPCSPERLESRLCLSGSAQFLGDLRTESVPPNVGQFLAAADFVYYTATDAPHGHELWRTDGTTEGTWLVKDINPGENGSDIDLSGSNATVVGNLMFFNASDGQHGRELWRTDGTSAGTFMLRDIYTGPGDSKPTELQQVGNDVFFVATSPTRWKELWKSDGTLAGTRLVRNDRLEPNSSDIRHLNEVNGTLLFVENRMLWKSDGTKEGTAPMMSAAGEEVFVVLDCGHSVCLFPPTKHEGLDLLFFESDELWVSDGTSRGTYSLSSVTPDAQPMLDESGLVFSSGNRINQEFTQLWRTDGTRGGTKLIADLAPDSSATPVAQIGELLYFAYKPNQHSSVFTLWQTDGTLQGTLQVPESRRRVFDRPQYVLGDTFFFIATIYTPELWKANADGVRVVRDTPPSESRSVAWTIPLNDQLLFNLRGQIWSTDESADEVELLYDNGPLSNAANAFTTWNGRLIFADINGQIWTTDGTPQGLNKVETPHGTFTEGSAPNSFVSAGGKNYFVASARNSSNFNLYAHDPQTEVVTLVKDLGTVPATSLTVHQNRLMFLHRGRIWSSYGTERTTNIFFATGTVQEFVIIGETLYIASGQDLWRRDRPAAGGLTILNRDIDGEPFALTPKELTVVGDILYFSAGYSGDRKLWRSDGTSEGTVLLTDLSANHSDFTAVGNKLFFLTNSGTQLWQSDGTEAGTSFVQEVNASQLTALGSSLLFVNDDDDTGRELWISDGTAAGTRLVEDLQAKERSKLAGLNHVVRAGDAIYFVADIDGSREGLWRLDANLVGEPVLVNDDFADIQSLAAFRDRPLVIGSRANGTPTLWTTRGDGRLVRLLDDEPSHLTLFHERLYFSHGGTLWQSDGTPEGTRSITTIDNGLITEITRVGDTLFFAADDGVHGRELWKTDGAAANQELVRDIFVGERGSNPSQLTQLGDSLLFWANDGSDGKKLWTSDGTAAGTRRVTDVVSQITADSSPDQYVRAGDQTYFVASDAEHGRELWMTDGTPEGTTIVVDATPGPDSSAMQNFQNIGDRLFFTWNRELWTYTASMAKPTRIPSIFDPREISKLHDSLYFVARPGCCRTPSLFRLDVSGTEVQTDGLTDFGLTGHPEKLTVVGDRIFFTAYVPKFGRELWQTDGTRDGTEMVKDILAAIRLASDIRQFVQVDDRIFFTAFVPDRGMELWVTDGSMQGTKSVAGRNDGLFVSAYADLTAFNGAVYFLDDGRRLWVSKGTNSTTRAVTENLSASSLTVVNETLLFVGNDGELGIELWKTDGTKAGTVIVRDINPGPAHGMGLSQIVRVEDTIYFTADDGIHGIELWRSDGTSEGTVLFRDVRPGSASSILLGADRNSLVAMDGRVYFSADSDGHRNAELWVTDGTETGTTMVYDELEFGDSGPLALGVADGWLYFSAASPGFGTELWRTDGTQENTHQVADLSPGLASSEFYPQIGFASLPDGKVVFAARTAQTGAELWVTDGTADGTYSLETTPGADPTFFANPMQIYLVGKFAYFLAGQDTTGYHGLWRTDGTVTGTELVVASAWADSPELALIDGELWFGVSHRDGNLARYRDGAISYLTVMWADPSASSSPSNLTAIGEEVFFMAMDATRRREIWRSGGTAESTRQVTDGFGGNAQSLRNQFADVGPDVYFTTTNPTVGLWRMPNDGSEAPQIENVQPAETDATSSNLLAWNDNLVFITGEANSASTLWTIDGSMAAPMSLSSLSSNELFHDARFAIVFQDQLFVIAETTTSESYLWRFDTPDSPPVLLTSAPVRTPLYVTGDELREEMYFTAFSPTIGWEPWISDGTIEGTRSIADVNIDDRDSRPISFAVQGELAYFLADEGQTLRRWQTDGTASGTRRASSVFHGLEDSARSFVIAKDHLYVNRAGESGEEVWHVDLPTSTANRIWADTEEQQFQELIHISDDRLFFLATDVNHGSELWLSDGTLAGTRIVRDIHPGATSSDVSGFVPFRDGYAFAATDAQFGRELWFTDGTTEGTQPVLDIRPGGEGSGIDRVMVVDDMLYFSADDGTHGREPWISDATASGTRMLINIDSRTIGSDPSDLTVLGSELFFAAASGETRRLWRWSTTMSAPEIVSGSVVDPQALVAANGRLYFSSVGTETGRELWTSDLTAAGTRLLEDLIPGPIGSIPQSITVDSEGGIFFSAVDAIHGRETWWLPPLDGDTDADHDVDVWDVRNLAANFGKEGTREHGDVDGDGFVGFRDFLLQQHNFSKRR